MTWVLQILCDRCDLSEEPFRKPKPLSILHEEAINPKFNTRQTHDKNFLVITQYSSNSIFCRVGTFFILRYTYRAFIAGFGAPVPNTLFGRISSFVYAVLAVPVHIYLSKHNYE